MFQQLTKAEYQTLAKTAKRIAVFKQIPMGSLTPVSAYKSLNAELNQGVILEDLQRKGTPTYAVVALDPLAKFSATPLDINPLDALRRYITELGCVTREDMAELINHAMGFIAYDAVRHFETIPDRHGKEHVLPNILFNFYRTTLKFDHEQQKVLVSLVTEVTANPEQDYVLAQTQIDKLITTLTESSYSPLAIPAADGLKKMSVSMDVSDNEYIAMVNKAKEYIVNGDAFQIVLSRNFKLNYTASPLDIYHTLRTVSPAPFMFYFPTEDGVIVGASPERLVRVQNGAVTINPIAGTRKRTGERKDEEIEHDLLSDQKECAEHMMLVDLARNDIGSVSLPGSVSIDELLAVKHFSHVSHITSVVSGKLDPKHDALDALAAAFPAGTLSGAPKIRAMEIIDELETSRRGIYGGAICRLDYKGNLDSCIAIRMAILKDGIATVRTGAGIVYDSNPLAEAEETRVKALGVMQTIARAHGASI